MHQMELPGGKTVRAMALSVVGLFGGIGSQGSKRCNRRNR